MGSLNNIAIGVTGICSAILIFLLVCLLAVRRRVNRGNRSVGSKYRRLDKSDLAITQEDTLGDGKKSLPLHKNSVPARPTTVTWADTVVQCQRKARSISCPEPQNVMTPLLEDTDATIESNNGAQTPMREKRSRKRQVKRSKTMDACYHVCQVQFTVFYNFYHCKLFLKLVCAVNIPSTFGVTYGSYIKVQLLPSLEKAATNIQFHTNNPVYDETVEFPDISHDDLMNKSLKIKLYTLDRFSHSSLVGQIVAAFAELEINPSKPTTVWRPISSNVEQLSTVSKGVSNRGELYISLRYQVFSNKVTVVVMKATNLPQVNKIFAIDPYVVIKLMLNLKMLQTRKTSYKRRTTSPCWNEPFVFEIDAKIPISEYSFCFKVMSRNSLSEDLTLGEVEIGYHTEGLGRQHWREMILKKNQDRAMCHKIG